MKFLVLFLLCGSLNSGASELERTWKETATWRADGEMLSVRLSRGKPWRIFVVGREEAKIDPATLKLTVRRLKPYPGEMIVVDRKGTHFEMGGGERSLGEIEELEIKAILKGEEETFHIRLKADEPASGGK
ncbi:MAG: hypothetical protein KF767_04230 [Bdellovibrionaceae bacterium]|nr:hypothetical protein [Pseudobdellovibrionaceae bacterium]